MEWRIYFNSNTPQKKHVAEIKKYMRGNKSPEHMCKYISFYSLINGGGDVRPTAEYKPKNQLQHWEDILI